MLRKLPQTGILINSPLLQFRSCRFAWSFGTAHASHEAQTRWELLCCVLPLWTASINSKESWLLRTGPVTILSLYISRLEIPIPRPPAPPSRLQVFTFSTKHTIFVCLASGMFWHHRAIFLQVTASSTYSTGFSWSWPRRMGLVELIRLVQAALTKSAVIGSGMGIWYPWPQCLAQLTKKLLRNRWFLLTGLANPREIKLGFPIAIFLVKGENILKYISSPHKWQNREKR